MRLTKLSSRELKTTSDQRTCSENITARLSQKLYILTLVCPTVYHLEWLTPIIISIRNVAPGGKGKSVCMMSNNLVHTALGAE